MATKKQFVDGKPAPITPDSKDQKVQDLTPSQNILSEDQDYDENEHSDDIAAFKIETGLDKEEKR
jgi:hypothetical protein